MEPKITFMENLNSIFRKQGKEQLDVQRISKLMSIGLTGYRT